jgi:hypothetical protein
MHSKVKAAYSMIRATEELFKASKGTLHSENTGDFCVLMVTATFFIQTSQTFGVLKAVNVTFTCLLSKRLLESK